MYILILLSLPFATVIGQSTDESVCRDKLDNCARYGQATCQKFQQWAQDNCRAFCQFCVAPPTTPVPCADKLGNCKDYGATVCQDPLYAPWVIDNCRYHCRQCSDDQLAIADSKTTTLPPPPCVDKIKICGRYGQSACTSYKPWAQDNCRNFCRYCTQEQLLIVDSKTTTTTTLATPPKPCADKIPHCDVYNDDICTNEKYRSWAEENCPVYCMLCSTSELNRRMIRGPTE
uniref:Tyrosinase-like protein tyr-3 isoform X3 n=1 Tax=Crassostrea virginica TaxID=6565 RepID=A0A8B8ELY9_CRAVI|nr:putative tyrosinase-like protein tyr-3 isoform X3 [Crassostrea virginica]